MFVAAASTADVHAIRRQTHAGRDYLVVPVVALVEGVLTPANAPGPELALAEEFGRFPLGWNGRPITLGHPKVDDSPVSANSPNILQQFAIGHMFNTQLDMTGTKLKSEAWIDLQRANAIGQNGRELLRRLESGEMVEVSTGLFMQLDPSPGSWDGQPFNAIWRNIVPDHLAMLDAGTIGACSVKDGCGAPRMNSVHLSTAANPDEALRNAGGGATECDCGGTCEKCAGVIVNIANRARTPSYNGTEKTSWGEVAKTFAAYREGYYKHNGGRPSDESKIPGNVKDAPAAMKRWIASKTLLGDPAASDNRDLIFFPVVNPSTDKLNEGALRAVISGRGTQAHIPEAAKSSAQNVARRLLEKEFGMKHNESIDPTLLEQVVGVMGRVFGLKPKDLSDGQAAQNGNVSTNDGGSSVTDTNQGGSNAQTNGQEQPANNSGGTQEKVVYRDPEPGSYTDVDRLMALAGGDAKKQLQEALEIRTQSRTQMIETITQVKDCEFSKEELEGMPTAMLQKMSKMAQNACNAQAQAQNQGDQSGDARQNQGQAQNQGQGSDFGGRANASSAAVDGSSGTDRNNERYAPAPPPLFPVDKGNGSAAA